MESKERTWLNWKNLINNQGTLTAVCWPTHQIIKTPVESHRLCNKAHKWMVTESRLWDTAVYRMFFLLDCRYTLRTAGGTVFQLRVQFLPDLKCVWRLFCERQWSVQREEPGAGYKWQLREKESVQQQRHWNRQTWTAVSRFTYFIHTCFQTYFVSFIGCAGAEDVQIFSLKQLQAETSSYWSYVSMFLSVVGLGFFTCFCSSQVHSP